MIDPRCPHCKEEDQLGSDREVFTCTHCGKQYMTCQFGWCFTNIEYPHDCSEHRKIHGACAMCGTSNEVSTKARIEALKRGEGTP